MRIFVTGASGYIGQAVAKAFRNKGHRVYGLVRSPEQAAELSLQEILPLIGDLNQLSTLIDQLDQIEVVVHCAFDSSTDGIQKDTDTIDIIIKSLSRSSLPRIFIYTSGIWVYGSKGEQIVDESVVVNPVERIKWRPGNEQTVLNAAKDNLKTVVIRPGLVYGQSSGLMKLFFASIQNGAIPVIGEGKNHWSMVHVEDLAHAYVSAAEKELGGVILNVVGDSFPTMREVAESIAKSAGLEGKIKNLSPDEAQKVFGDLWEGLAIDLKVDNSRIKRLMKWQTHHAPFIEEADIYYQAWLASQNVDVF